VSRAVEIWVGKTDDSMPPPRVRLRIFERCGGVCHRSGRKIRAGDKWALDHVIALINGGRNDELNLAPILDEEHKVKSAEDLAIKSKTYRMASKFAGTWPKSKTPLKGRGFSAGRNRASTIPLKDR
jgi:5-methylcytosine-specific restriction protein A